MKQFRLRAPDVNIAVRRIPENPATTFYRGGRAQAADSSVRRHGKGRRGTSILELIAASFLISLAMAAAVPLLAFSAGQDRAARQHEIALQEAANTMEQISVESQLQSWDQIRQSPRVVSAEAAAHLADPRLQVDVIEIAGPPKGVRVTVAVSWKGCPGAHPAPARLVTWFYDTIREAD